VRFFRVVNLPPSSAFHAWDPYLGVVRGAMTIVTQQVVIINNIKQFISHVGFRGCV